jgi:hypothetical protein
MNAALKSSAVVVWHHRALGTFWALCGLVPAVSALARSSWSEGPFFISVSAAAIFVSTSIGFIFGSTWARRVMCMLMLIAVLFFLDMLLMFGWHGNREGVWMMLAALGAVAYTLLFLAISALHHPKNHDNKHVA